MGGNIGEIQGGSERELYFAVVTKASSKFVLVQVYKIFGLLITNRSSGLQ